MGYLDEVKAVTRAPDDKIEPEREDYKTAAFMLADIHNRESWSLPWVLAQWVALIRKREQERY